MPKVYLLESLGARILSEVSPSEAESLVYRRVARWVDKRHRTAQMITGARSRVTPNPMSYAFKESPLTYQLVLKTAECTTRW
jgi:hypothetical protein